ncbi:hypothetical protein CCMA1212_002210 [Trichoderma ghanense]|uniref:Uncharacterized protein n=1 Tax=Trichoderma ghanense TaxID=65468 RepID=A0ABY2HD92_9HYPO
MLDLPRARCSILLYASSMIDPSGVVGGSSIALAWTLKGSMPISALQRRWTWALADGSNLRVLEGEQAEPSATTKPPANTNERSLCHLHPGGSLASSDLKNPGQAGSWGAVQPERLSALSSPLMPPWASSLRPEAGHLCGARQAGDSQIAYARRTAGQRFAGCRRGPDAGSSPGAPVALPSGGVGPRMIGPMACILALSQTMLQLRLSGATTPALPNEARVMGPA